MFYAGLVTGSRCTSNVVIVISILEAGGFLVFKYFIYLNHQGLLRGRGSSFACILIVLKNALFDSTNNLIITKYFI